MGYMTSRAMPVQPMMSMGYAPAPVYHFPQSLSAAPSQQVSAPYHICFAPANAEAKCLWSMHLFYAHCPKPSCPALNPALP